MTERDKRGNNTEEKEVGRKELNQLLSSVKYRPEEEIK
jgi:hypothetical protein